MENNASTRNMEVQFQCKSSLLKHNTQNITNYSTCGLVPQIHKEFFCALHVLNTFISWKDQLHEQFHLPGLYTREILHSTVGMKNTFTLLKTLSCITYNSDLPHSRLYVVEIGKLYQKLCTRLKFAD